MPNLAMSIVAPRGIGEAVAASIGNDHAEAPVSDSQGIRVSIPGHPEIVAYKLAGNPTNDRIIDDLIGLDRLIKAQEANTSV